MPPATSVDLSRDLSRDLSLSRLSPNHRHLSRSLSAPAFRSVMFIKSGLHIAVWFQI
ncbi:hypothetical protein Syun_028089 [Stephania yunnanensis]|uniref:Uncharacterized protein n=1 Tax=Stephania yunnanensis TaxID=152371 RepID=A0AAP0HLL4_9MAGN